MELIKPLAVKPVVEPDQKLSFNEWMDYIAALLFEYRRKKDYQ